MKTLKIKQTSPGCWRVKWGKIPVMIVQPSLAVQIGAKPSVQDIRAAIESNSSPGDKILPEFLPVYL